MKTTISLFAILISSISLAGSLDSIQIGPGVTHYHQIIDSGPWNINIIKIDLQNPWLKFQSVKAGDKLQAFEKTTSMASRNNYEEHKVVAAINGDFYNTSTGEQIGSQIADGELLKSNNNWLNVAFDYNKKPVIGLNNFSGSIISSDSIRNISGVNKTRNNNELIFYNSFMGTTTSTNQYGTEARIIPIDKWLVNDTIRCLVETVISGVGNAAIGNNKAVISGHGSASAFIVNNLSAGDTIKIVLNLLPSLPGLEQLVGGNTWLVQNGVVNPDNGDRHPRTSVGFNQDTTVFFMFVVDGRQPLLSIGMTYKELGDYMKTWGVQNGLNLDGGGSSTMVVRGNLVNSPSDPGGERSVSNSLLLVSTAPTSNLASIRINPREIFINGGKSITLTAKGFDEYFNPVTIPAGSLVWSCDPSIGSINQSGKFTASFDTVSGFIYAEVGNIRDSVIVHLTKISQIILTPNPVILQPGQSQQMTATAYDNYNNVISLQQNDFQWSVTNNLGTINSSGYFTANYTGSGQIIASIDSINGTAELLVGTSTTVMLDDFSDLSGYTLTGTRVNLSQCSFLFDSTIFISAPGSGKLNYSLTTGGTSALYLNKEIQISGTPEKLSLQVYGDGKKHWLRGEFKDKDNETFLIDFTNSDPGIDWIDTWKYIEINLSNAVPSWVNPSAVLDFPIKWVRTYLAETNDGKKDNGVIYFDDFRAHFIATDVEYEEAVPKNFKLNQNFPNPFNPVTNIQFAIANKQFVTLKVYDVLGTEIATLVNEYKPAGHYSVKFTSNNLSSGIYYYRLQASDPESNSGQSFTETKKMILLK
ncbi:MAG: phosphodiester glycosidase family protein [Ignavibacterium sp.]|nr:phosphodiester glycosidase family protein [Ignavibacterium sp.]